jgi:hypothetical protein
LCWDFYARQSGSRDGVTGIAILVLGSLGLWKYRDLAASPIFGAMVVGGLAIGLRPTFDALRVKLAFRHGRPALAEVISLNDITNSRVTLQGLTNGWAEGVRLVQTDTLEFEDRFATDEPGSRALKPGSVMRVLVDTRRPDVLVELGVVSR